MSHKMRRQPLGWLFRVPTGALVFPMEPPPVVFYNFVVSQFPKTFVIAAEDAGKRLDQFLVTKIPEVSRVRIQQLIAQAKVRVNAAVAKPSLKLRGGERVQVFGPAQVPPLRAMPEDIPLDMVYEDEDLAVVNKPAGMMVHAGAGATDDARNRGTLVNALLHRLGKLSQAGGELRPGIVHRLDRSTSGLIVVAKNDRAHRNLAEQFAGREVHKTYIALVHGILAKETGTVATSISRDTIRRTRMTTRRSGGRTAVTHWRVLERIDGPWGKFTLAEVKIETGRTHQIRVHLSSIGHPVVGDTLYGAPRQIKGPENAALSLPRNFLHAAEIEFTHPRSHARLHFSRTLPPELQEFLTSLSRG
jgi:23S rRNA pseudouridine1911/1915/1917 synthase